MGLKNCKEGIHQKILISFLICLKQVIKVKSGRN